MRVGEDRHQVFWIVMLFLGVIIPIITALGTLFVYGWLAVIGVHNARGAIDWWIHRTYYTNGTSNDEPSRWMAVYYLSLVTTALLYEVLEIVAALTAMFARRLRLR